MVAKKTKVAVQASGKAPDKVKGKTGAHAEPQRIGGRIRHLRRRLGMSQRQLAERLDVSVSYLNLLEHNRRKVTIPLLLSLSEIFSVNMEELIESEDHQLFASLMTLLGDDMFESLDITNLDVSDFSRDLPHLARAMLILHDNLTRSRSDLQTLSAQMPDMHESRDIGLPVTEIISDFIQDNRNFFPQMEQAAATIRKAIECYGDNLSRNLQRYLSEHCDVSTVPLAASDNSQLRQVYDAERKELRLSQIMEPAGRRFAMAYRIGLLQADAVINDIMEDAGFASGAVRKLGRIALANYFAAALVLPYDDFLANAQACRYDIELLQMRHKVSFEQVCHRLTTLNSPNNAGIPLHLVKTDMAGNIRKRFSLSGLPIPRHAGVCARWNIFDSFTRPATIQSQLSRLPNGDTFLCIAASIRKGGRGFVADQSFVAIGIGCDIMHADKMVYGDNYYLQKSRQVRDIGVTCRICERQNCAERITPAVQGGFNIDEDVRGTSPFMNSAVQHDG